MRLLLILKSRGESDDREGDKLASNNQGFSSESIKISNPRISKQLDLCDQNLFKPA